MATDHPTVNVILNEKPGNTREKCEPQADAASIIERAKAEAEAIRAEAEAAAIEIKAAAVARRPWHEKYNRMYWAEWRNRTDARAGTVIDGSNGSSSGEKVCKDAQFPDSWYRWIDYDHAKASHKSSAYQASTEKSWSKWEDWGTWGHSRKDSGDYWPSGRSQQRSTPPSKGYLHASTQSIGNWCRDGAIAQANSKISSSWKNCNGCWSIQGKKVDNAGWRDYGVQDESGELNSGAIRRRSEPPPCTGAVPAEKDSGWSTRNLKGSVYRQSNWHGSRDGSRWNTPKRCRSRDSLPSLQVVDQSSEFRSKYEIERPLAAGSKGVTFLATEKNNGSTVVVKKPNNPRDTRDFDRLVDKRHPNIVRVFECFTGPAETFVVMEFYAGGDLFQAVECYGARLSHAWAASAFKQMLTGVKYLHDFGESHNDLKLENLLLDRQMADVNDVPRIVVADLGCAAEAGSRRGGDPRYRAPETFFSAPFGFETDVWALGVCLYELLTGGFLIHIHERNLCGWHEFESHERGALCDRFMKIMKSKPPTPVKLDNIVGTEIQDLLGDLLDVYPYRRMTMESALAHPWLAIAGGRRVEHDGPCKDRRKAQTHCSDSDDEDLERPRSPRKFGGC